MLYACVFPFFFALVVVVVIIDSAPSSFPVNYSYPPASVLPRPPVVAGGAYLEEEWEQEFGADGSAVPAISQLPPAAAARRALGEGNAAGPGSTAHSRNSSVPSTYQSQTATVNRRTKDRGQLAGGRGGATGTSGISSTSSSSSSLLPDIYSQFMPPPPPALPSAAEEPPRAESAYYPRPGGLGRGGTAGLGSAPLPSTSSKGGGGSYSKSSQNARGSQSTVKSSGYGKVTVPLKPTPVPETRWR